MPNFNSPIYSKQTNASNTTTRLNSPADEQKFDIVEVVFTVPAGMVANDTITLFRLKQDQKLHATSQVYFPALGASTAMTVGTPSSPASFLASTATTAAGKAFLDAGYATRANTPAPTSPTSNDVVATITGGNPTATSVIRFVLHVQKPQ